MSTKAYSNFVELGFVFSTSFVLVINKFEIDVFLSFGIIFEMIKFENNFHMLLSYAACIVNKIKSGLNAHILPVEYMIETFAMVFKHFWFK